jgi:hypothetical protein
MGMGMGIIYNDVKNKCARIIMPIIFDRSSLHESHESDARHLCFTSYVWKNKQIFFFNNLLAELAYNLQYGKIYTISQDFLGFFTQQEKTRQ